MLQFEHPRFQRFGRVVGKNGERRLADDRAVVEAFGDEMNRAAMQFHTGGERAGVRIAAGERRRQGGVDVDDTALPYLLTGIDWRVIDEMFSDYLNQIP